MKLSIITINLNNKVGLEQTIQSVLSQTYMDYEFIVIDGVSSDGSIDVIEKYKDNITNWISESDTGVYNAMNKGIGLSKGEYCYFLNSGDVFASDTVLENIFKSDRTESFICGNFIWDEKGKLKKDDSYKYRDWTFSIYDIYAGYLCHQAFFINKTMFEKYGYYDETLRIMSDWKLFFLAIGINRECVKYIDTDIAIYNTDGLSSTIGGQFILGEKRKAAKEILSEQAFAKIDRLYYLQRNGFWVDFIYSKKWILFLCKSFLKFCEIFKLTKI